MEVYSDVTREDLWDTWAEVLALWFPLSSLFRIILYSINCKFPQISWKIIAVTAMLHLRSKKKFFEPCLVSWYLAVADTGMMLAWSENGGKLESNRFNLPCSWFYSVRAMCDCCRCSRQQKVATNGQQRVNKGSTKGHWSKKSNNKMLPQAKHCKPSLIFTSLTILLS